MSSIPTSELCADVVMSCDADVDVREAEVKTALTNLLGALQNFKFELAHQRNKLSESQKLMLDQLTDQTAANVIRNMRKSLDEKAAELSSCQRKLEETQEAKKQLERMSDSKSNHIEKLSSLLLLKEEKIQELEGIVKDNETKLASLESLLESKAESSDRWRVAAQQAAGKMKEHLATLKASEEMNEDLRKLLDKKVARHTSVKSANERPCSPVSDPTRSLDSMQEYVNNRYSSSTALTSTGTTPITSQPEVIYRIVQSPVVRTMSSKHEPTSLTDRSNLTTSVPETKVIYKIIQSPLLRTLSAKPEPAATHGVSGERYDITSPSPAESTDDTASPATPRVRFRLDDLTDAGTSGDDGQIRYPAPMPNFSRIVADALDAERIHDPVLWRYFIRECVHFYYDILPTSETAARNSYYNIGRTLYEQFPCIAKEGPNFKTPWTYFNTCLSSRLRNERFCKKRASEKRSDFGPCAEDDTRQAVYSASGELLPSNKRIRLGDVSPSSADASDRWTQESCHL